jgi:hypothetical protein
MFSEVRQEFIVNSSLVARVVALVSTAGPTSPASAREAAPMKCQMQLC